MKIRFSIKMMLLLFSLLFLPGRNQLGNQVLVALQLLRKEGEQVQPKLLLKSQTHWLLSQLIKKFMSQRLGSVESVFGGVYHDLSQEVEKERVSFGENLNRIIFTLLHYLFLTLGNL